MDNFIYLKKVTSTNDYIKENIEKLNDLSVVFADIQTNGKGRLGKEWKTPTGNISMSVLFKNQSNNIYLYPLICGLVTSEVVDKVCGVNTKIKWPNDVILNNKKLCGILCESIVNKSNMHAICGIGVNVNIKQNQFQKEQLPFGTSLYIELKRDFDPVEMAKLIADNLIQKIKTLNEEGFSSLKVLYENKLININREVKIIYKNETIVATCLGISHDGNLLCNYNGKNIKINSGDASVRGLYGYV